MWRASTQLTSFRAVTFLAKPQHRAHRITFFQQQPSAILLEGALSILSISRYLRQASSADNSSMRSFYYTSPTTHKNWRCAYCGELRRSDKGTPPLARRMITRIWGSLNFVIFNKIFLCSLAKKSTFSAP